MYVCIYVCMLKLSQKVYKLHKHMLGKNLFKTYVHKTYPEARLLRIKHAQQDSHREISSSHGHLPPLFPFAPPHLPEVWAYLESPL